MHKHFALLWGKSQNIVVLLVYVLTGSKACANKGTTLPSYPPLPHRFFSVTLSSYHFLLLSPPPILNNNLQAMKQQEQNRGIHLPGWNIDYEAI